MDPTAPAPAAAPATANPDMLDKAFAQGATKLGGAQGAKIAGNRNLVEKITDKIRGVFEKATGKKVPSKISN